MEVPDYLHRYFWDVRANELATDRDGRFIAERILENGDERAVAWLKDALPRSELEATVRESRRLSPKSRNYWKHIYHVWPASKQSMQTRDAIWRR